MIIKEEALQPYVIHVGYKECVVREEGESKSLYKGTSPEDCVTDIVQRLISKNEELYTIEEMNQFVADIYANISVKKTEARIKAEALAKPLTEAAKEYVSKSEG